MKGERGSLGDGVLSLARRVFYGTRRLLEIHVLKTRALEWSWRWKHLFRPDLAKEHWLSVDHPHRPLLVERIIRKGAPNTLLEIGCNSAPNLFRLAQAFPESRFFGVDINANSITYGRERLREAGVTNVELSVTSGGDRLSAFSDKSVDVVHPIGAGIGGDSRWDQFGAIIEVQLAGPHAG